MSENFVRLRDRLTRFQARDEVDATVVMRALLADNANNEAIEDDRPAAAPLPPEADETAPIVAGNAETDNAESDHPDAAPETSDLDSRNAGTGNLAEAAAQKPKSAKLSREMITQRVLAKTVIPDEPLVELPDMLQTNGRKAPRKASCLPGYVKIEGRQRMIACKIMDMSATGACIEITPAKGPIREDIDSFPDFVTLFLTFDKVRIASKIAWRNERDMGVQFLSPPETYS